MDAETFNAAVLRVLIRKLNAQDEIKKEIEFIKAELLKAGASGISLDDYLLGEDNEQ